MSLQFNPKFSNRSPLWWTVWLVLAPFVLILCGVGLLCTVVADGCRAGLDFVIEGMGL